MENCSHMRLMREGNAFYEVDEECLKRGLNQAGREEDRQRGRKMPPDAGKSQKQS